MLMAAVGDGEVAHRASSFSDLAGLNLTMSQVDSVVTDTTLTS